jgi:DNA-binding response OmpR family regulator
MQDQSPFILIADDHVDLATTLAILMKLAGYQTEVVHDGEAALLKARLRVPDILLIDIGLPKLDGFQVVKRLRNDNRLKSTRIIAISGYPPEMFKGMVGKVEFDFHLVKPVDFDDLLPLLRFQS